MASSFVTPKVELQPTTETSVRTLPDLIEFHYRHNPKHFFCLQAEQKRTSALLAASPSSDPKEYDFVSISYEQLYHAILKCQKWLGNSASSCDFHSPVKNENGDIIKCAPVAILMESDASLAIYVLALMALGIPAVVLSSRLSPLAIRHLIQATGAKLAVTSTRLHLLMSEAFSTTDSDVAQDGKNVQSPTVCVGVGYQSLLERDDGDTRHIEDGLSIAHPLHFIAENDRQVVILHSSGSSGLPKPIYCSHRYFLGFAVCHSFVSAAEAQGLAISTSPFFHGFGMVPICLSLGIGKTFCIPPSSTISTGSSIAALIRESGAKALLTVPSLLEEMASLPNSTGLDALRQLDFAAFGGGIPKESIGKDLVSAGVNLINHYGATETGPLTPFFVPPEGHNWRLLKLRNDTIGPLDVRLDPVDNDGADNINEKAYKLSMRPFGWSERFELQDLLVSSEGNPEGEFSIAGRTDDLICLATGEKVRPTILEDCLRQHPGVKAVSAFGDNQFELGILIESAEPLDQAELPAFRTTIWPLIEKANQDMDAHARISSPSAVVIVGPGALPKSDKGTVPRREAAAKFADEIATVYQELLEGAGNTAVGPIDVSSPASSIRDLVTACVGRTAASDTSDFFAELGMDSLQATRLQRMLSRSVNLSSGLVLSKIPDGFVYRNPSIECIVGALTMQEHPSQNELPASHQIEQLVREYSITDMEKRSSLGEHVFIFTGATGSLGAHILSQLVQDSSVKRIFCLNRVSKGQVSPAERQRRALNSRGLQADDNGWSKVVVYETDTASPKLGLSEEQYSQLAMEATHILHMAWPMSFKMALGSFSASFRTLRNLIELTVQAHQQNSLRNNIKPKLVFVSSISTVGNYSSGKGHEKDVVPEIFVDDASWSLSLGYAQAKLVCENMIRKARDVYPELRAGVVRIGQLAGSTANGYWNADEHLVAIFSASKNMGKFPDIQGTLSWLPVDLASTALLEILMNKAVLPPICHLENPVRQDWRDTTATLMTELGMESSRLMPTQEWLDLVALYPKIEGDSSRDNPAYTLVDFLQHDFTRMSCGSLVLDTAVAQGLSPTLRAMDAVGHETMRAYVAYWKSINILK